jgi:hypothetical protein
MPAPKVGSGYGVAGGVKKGPGTAKGARPKAVGGGAAAGTAGKTRPKITRPVVGGAGGKGKAIPGGGTKPRPVKGKTIPGRKPAPGSRVRPGGPATKPNRAAQIAKKKKVFAAKRANKLANQKKLASRKRALARKRKLK